ncbi:hypothetical protein J1N35_016382 [Gossypium stocksii]|uniref:Uncharacterized protein n=1 Tax=Gossypium stocksii TaxID=47602 RepID=A0A9D4A549_9ROSI|nr:hypothetical protein J1N35_016382 [Gossypium stocksii]
MRMIIVDVYFKSMLPKSKVILNKNKTFLSWTLNNCRCNPVATKCHWFKARAFKSSTSESVCINESQSSSTMPYRTTLSRTYLGPLAGTLTPTRKEDLENPYLNHRELNIEHQQRFSTSAMPIYLVT